MIYEQFNQFSNVYEINRNNIMFPVISVHIAFKK